MKLFLQTGRPDAVRISNGAATVEDVLTGQMWRLLVAATNHLAGRGQRRSFLRSYGSSTIKSLVFTQLFDKRDNRQVCVKGTVLIVQIEYMEQPYETGILKFMAIIRRASSLCHETPLQLKQLIL